MTCKWLDKWNAYSVKINQNKTVILIKRYGNGFVFNKIDLKRDG